ncbi:hypothetical protein SAMN06265174_102505 [Dietzia kunjamensis subsp. schimae]|uniref:Uncharacterized protein n=1 Tax=Dietzia kunjamensis subsp. schimae TaxID=498198 RepID=A0ABY1MZH2_9ACTN|nr:hypothetical protein [Dietzia kunjamensis]SMO59135.1 hypothetical protein SAMN06265174_102505 [Dietzia kunjamensis subsp. schimae]
MTNTHRKTTNRTTAKIAAVGAFGLGAAIAFPGLAAAEAPTDPTASLADITGEDGSLEGALGTDLNLDLGSLAFNLNLDAETPNPGSVELGSLGVSPNTGSALIDGNSGSAEDETETATGSATGSADEDATDADADSGSLDLGSLGSSDETTDDTDGVTTAAVTEEAPAASGSLGSSDETTDEAPADETAAETGALSGSLAGLSSGAEDGDGTTVDAGAELEADAGLNFGSLG